MKQNSFFQQNQVLILAAVLGILFWYGGSQGWFKSISSTSTTTIQQSAPDSQAPAPLAGCTNACGVGYNQKPAPDCTCFAASTNGANWTVGDIDTNLLIDVANKCIDGDGGPYPHTKGTTTEYTKNNQISQQMTDECSDVHPGWIREYVCVGDELDYQDLQCTGLAGCANGACLPLTCNDVCKWDKIYNAPWGIDSTESYCSTQGVDRYWKPVSSLSQNVDASRGCCCYTLTT